MGDNFISLFWNGPKFLISQEKVDFWIAVNFVCKISTDANCYMADFYVSV